MPMSPTALSLRHLRAAGYLAEVVEHRVPHTFNLRDLWGFVDIVAVRPNETLGVQCTSRGNMASRIRKIAESPHISAVREAGWRLEVHGWDKPAHRWRVKVTDVS
jgi:hypothetical protein